MGGCYLNASVCNLSLIDEPIVRSGLLWKASYWSRASVELSFLSGMDGDDGAGNVRFEHFLLRLFLLCDPFLLENVLRFEFPGRLLFLASDDSLLNVEALVFVKDGFQPAYLPTLPIIPPLSLKSIVSRCSSSEVSLMTGSARIACRGASTAVCDPLPRCTP